MSVTSTATATAIERSPAPASNILFEMPERRRTLAICLLLFALVLLAYKPITRNGFINYDDNAYITENTHVQAGLTWATVRWAFTTYEQGNWHPLTWISHAFDCQLFGLNPSRHHLVNVLLHAVNAVLLFLLLQTATGFRWRSLFVAALFAIHPINVESVAWAAERKNVLSMTFFLLALYAYGWYAQKPRIARYFSVFTLFALALLSKPQVIVFPCLLLLWDYWPLQRMTLRFPPRAPGFEYPRVSMARSILEKLPLFGLASMSAVVTLKAQQAGLAVQTLSRYSVTLRLQTAVISYVRYIGKAIWPSKLVAMYPHPATLYPTWQVVIALVFLLLGTGFVIHNRDRRYLAVGWLWFLGSLVPMIGLVQVGLQAMADRYAYISFLGLFLMFTWLAADVAKAHEISFQWLTAAAIVCLLSLGLATHRQERYWHDSESFWVRTSALTGNDYVAEVNLGSLLFSEGRGDEAAAHFRSALLMRPNGLTAALNLGAYEDGRGNLSAAIQQYQTVALHAADAGMRTKAYNNLGFAYRGLRQPSKASECFEMALQLSPGSTRAITGLALIAQSKHDLPEAIRLYKRANELQPTDVGYLLLAQVLREQGDVAKADAASEQAARVSPNLMEAQKATESLLSGR